MKILAIESSGTVASAALWEDGKVLVSKTGPFKVTHSETLMPMVAEVMREAEGTGSTSQAGSAGGNQGRQSVPARPDLIAVSGGPGSFTGLRIGSATAKGLGMAWGINLIHVPTLDAMAYNFADRSEMIVPMMDARRGQVYTGIYRFTDGRLEILKAGCAMAASDLIAEINENWPSEKFIFLGDGCANVVEAEKDNIKVNYVVADADNIYQRADSVAILGAKLASEGKIVSADMEAPEYLRLSQAERVRAEGGE